MISFLYHTSLYITPIILLFAYPMHKFVSQIQNIYSYLEAFCQKSDHILRTVWFISVFEITSFEKPLYWERPSKTCGGGGGGVICYYVYFTGKSCLCYFPHLVNKYIKLHTTYRHYNSENLCIMFRKLINWIPLFGKFYCDKLCSLLCKFEYEFLSGIWDSQSSSVIWAQRV